jgi:hypothetical protein
VFVPGRLFQPNLMFLGKARRLKGTLSEKALDFLTNNILGWKGLQGTDTSSLQNKIADVKSFIALGHGRLTNLFIFVTA